MANEAEELVREVFARWNAGDRELDPELYLPDLTIHSALTGRVYEGDDGVRSWIAEIDEQFRDWNLRIDELEVRNEGLVIVVGEIGMTGRKSDVRMPQPASWIAEIEGGRLACLRNFIGREKAAGFAEDEL